MIRQGAQRTFRNRLQLHLMPTYWPCVIGVGGGGGGYWGTRFHSLSVACLGIVVKKQIQTQVLGGNSIQCRRVCALGFICVYLCYLLRDFGVLGPWNLINAFAGVCRSGVGSNKSEGMLFFWEILREVRDFIGKLSCILYLCTTPTLH